MTDPTTTPDADADADAAAAWRALTAGLDALATRLLADDFPSTPRGRDEAFRHLAQQATCWLTWA
jgi:hypothetical protein